MFWKKSKTGPSGGLSESTVTNVIHAVELGAMAKYIKMFLFALAVFLVLLIYQSNQFRGLEHAEAIDQAQIARNIARGEGFTTKFIRPQSAWHLKQTSEDKDAKLKAAHPDLCNPPLFPYTLAAVFKFKGPSFEVKATPPQPYTRFPPETWIAATSEFFFFASAILMYLLARRLFDKKTAFISLLVFLLSEPLWKYAVSGLATTMAMFLFFCAQYCLVSAHSLSQQEGKHTWVWLLAAGAGLFCGLCALTIYSAGWLVVPALAFAVFALGKQRWIAVALVFVLFVATLAPWLVRNNGVSGRWFGLASYAPVEQSERFPNDQVMRSFKENTDAGLKHSMKNAVQQLRAYLNEGWGPTGAGLAAAFFLASLLYRFNKSEVLAYRRFLVGAMILAAIVSGFGSMITASKGLAADSSNLVILLSPGLVMIGVKFFFLLFDRVNLRLMVLKHVCVTLFVLICAASFIFTVLPPRRGPVRYPSPPYYEPIISLVANWANPDELFMSDMPWAIAWYGDRKAIWIPNTMEEFYQINDFNHRIAGIYLTPLTMDRKFASEMVGPAAEMRPWATLALGQPPQGFPLVARTSIPGFEPGHLILMDRARWVDEKKP